MSWITLRGIIPFPCDTCRQDIVRGERYQVVAGIGAQCYNCGNSGPTTKRSIDPVIAALQLPMDSDAEENRLRNLLKPKIDPGNCICGIHKSRCEFHNDPITLRGA